MTPRRELITAVTLCVLGGVLVLVAAAQPWLTEHVVRPPFPTKTVQFTGSQLSDLPRALGYVAVAGALALAATRGWTRVAAGALLAAVGVGLVAAVWTVPSRPGATMTAWPWAATAGAVLVVAGGALTAARGRRWATMSARYDAPAARRAVSADPHVEQWEALDRGDDPTLREPHAGDAPVDAVTDAPADTEDIAARDNPTA